MKTKLNFSKSQKIFLISLWVGVFGLGLIIFLLNKIAPILIGPFVIFIIFAGTMIYRKAIGKPAVDETAPSYLAGDPAFDPLSSLYNVGGSED